MDMVSYMTTEHLFNTGMRENEISNDLDIFIDIMHDVENNNFYTYVYCLDNQTDMFTGGIDI